MKVTSKGQVTIPLHVRNALGITPAQTEVEFKQNDAGQWYLAKATAELNKSNRFRSAHQVANITMSTEEIMALTRV